MTKQRYPSPQERAHIVARRSKLSRERLFLAFEEFLRLNDERAMLVGRTVLKGEHLPEADQQRLDELTDAVLSDAFLWDDLVPETPPKALVGEGHLKKVGRNEPCPCGSGKKYKHCHGR